MSGGRARIEGQSKGPVDQISMDLNVLEVRGRAIRDKWEGWEGSTANSVASVHSGCFSGLDNHLSRCATRRTLGDSGVCRRDVGKPHFQRAGTTGIQEYFVSQSIASVRRTSRLRFIIIIVAEKRADRKTTTYLGFRTIVGSVPQPGKHRLLI